jgi:hypothetical protein
MSIFIFRTILGTAVPKSAKVGHAKAILDRLSVATSQFFPHPPTISGEGIHNEIGLT